MPPTVNPALETLLLACDHPAAVSSNGHALFLGAQPHPSLADWPRLTGWQPLKPLANAWDQQGFHRMDAIPAEATWPLVLVLPGKSRDETLHAFALANQHLQHGGRLIAALPNTAGAARFEKELATATGSVESIQKHKCRAFSAQKDGGWNQTIFNDWLNLGRPQAIPGSDFITVPGIFSSGHIDPGSALLAAHLPASLRGRAADLGAGWGFLSDAALRRCPAIETIDLYEADARALDCARHNLAPHATRGTTFLWHDVTAGLPQTYDVILMNPPFHSGQAADLDLARSFLHSAAASLRPAGRLLMVANRQLPYEALLTPLGLSWRITAENSVYKLIFAEKRHLRPHR